MTSEQLSEGGAEVILASSSVYRRRQMDQLGISYRWLSPAVDEDSLKSVGGSPRELASYLAKAKAESLAKQHPRAILIGSDQLVSLDGEILGKPGTPERAVEQLSRMAGRSHELITALAVHHDGRTILHVDVSVLTMRDFSSEALTRYVAADNPFDCAGSYKFESRGVVLFERVESRDPSAITGLPLMALVSILREFSVQIP